MFSRKLDRVNIAMTIECLFKLPIGWLDFLKLYRSFKPDVIYLANYHEIVLLAPLLFWVRHKVICHIHDPPPAIGFQKFSFSIWRRVVGRFFFISRDVQNRTACLGSHHTTDVVIYNGVEIAPLPLPRFRSRRFCEMFGWPEDTVIFGITGQLIPTKGHEDFVAAAYLASASNKKLKFVIGGRDSEQFAQQLRKLIGNREMGQSISFCGWLPRAMDFYDGIDVLILASRHDEGFGLVIAEAAERGVPAISTRSGGATEVILDGQSGIVVDKNDPRSLANAIIRLAGDDELRKEMGIRARDRIVKKFNLDLQSKEFAKLLYQSIV
jgi:glycosyltransferase involved in cell wall biosynthesis